MIRISQVKLPISHSEQDLYEKTARLLRVPCSSLKTVTVVKRSIDARKKDQILFIYQVDVETGNGNEAQIVKRANSPQIMIAPEERYHFPAPGTGVLNDPPLIIGSGPAGLFSGYLLAEAGYCPVILERGDAVDVRRTKVERFWNDGILDERSNVQFGEGGAGTFSDGKLNTMVRDPSGRNRKVLEILTEHGADPRILTDAKPHIGTDVLSEVVKNLRTHIISLGGRVVFGAQVTDLCVKQGHVTGVKAVLRDGQQIAYPAETVILAIGHSARDTFSMLEALGVPMQAKSFAVGLRIQHPQRMIDRAQYGDADVGILGPASYKLTHQTRSGRGVYSFCMCPGGYVVNASSEQGRLAVNGMSNHDRAAKNANSALIVTVTPADYGTDSPLSGVEFQKRLEELAFREGAGKIPVQLYGDFKENRVSSGWKDVEPEFKGQTHFADLHRTLPAWIAEPLIEGVETFGQKLEGFSRYDSILAGVESRTSSPVRILRSEHFESAVKGLFPCGEGAGYAGGITSAAMDGMKVAEEVARRYKTIQNLQNSYKTILQEK